MKFSVCGKQEEHEWVSKSYLKKKKKRHDGGRETTEGQRQEEVGCKQNKGNERKKVQLWCDDGDGDGGGVQRRSVTPGVSQTLAALQFVALLAISGGRDADVHHVVAWRLVVRRSVCYLLLRHDAVDFCNDNNNKNICMDCWKQDLRDFNFVFDTKPARVLTEVRKTFGNAAAL